MNYWLVKSEADCYSIDNLKHDKVMHWDGVRNYQARNFMKIMKKGERVLFYHSTTKPVGIAGLAEVQTEAYPDFTAWDKKSEHPDPKSTPEKPLWFMVDLKFVEIFPKLVSLEDIRKESRLQNMVILRRASRLSVTPVSKEEFEYIVTLAHNTI